MNNLQLQQNLVQCLAVLNGVMGDLLDERKSGLAIRMNFYFQNRPLPVTRDSLEGLKLPDGGKVCILAHGSCHSENGWKFRDEPASDYGSFLKQDLGYAPFYLRYNSGLHISDNGRQLSLLLEKLVRQYPQALNEMILIGHSMGGLIFRSACYYGKKDGKKWVGLVKKIFYLGSPHFGTYFERLGKLTTSILNAIPTLPTKIIAHLGEFRSDGIKDLRHGYITHKDWSDYRSDGLFYLHRKRPALLKTAEHYLICGTISKNAGSKMARLFGDGLVHPASGTGRGFLKSGGLNFLEENCKTLAGVSHYSLLKSREVYRQIRDWCSKRNSDIF